MTVAAFGAQQTDLAGGTPIWDRSRSDARFNSPTGCAVCNGGDDERDNQNLVAKVWYVWSTRRFGSHELMGGVDLFQETRRADAIQSGSGFRIRATRSIIAGDQVYPSSSQIGPRGSTGRRSWTNRSATISAPTPRSRATRGA